MKRILVILWLIVSAVSLFAGDKYVQMDLTVTNVAVTSNTIAFNSHTRIWTNATTATTILTNSVGPAPTATNLYNAIGNTPENLMLITPTGTNSFHIEGKNLTVAIGGTWASLSGFTTNDLGDLHAQMTPVDSLSATNRTNNMSDMSYGLSKYDTNTSLGRDGFAQTNKTGLTLNSFRGTNTGTIFDGTYSNATFNGGLLQWTYLGSDFPFNPAYNRRLITLANGLGGVMSFTDGSTTNSLMPDGSGGDLLYVAGDGSATTPADGRAPGNDAIVMNKWTSDRLYGRIYPGSAGWTNLWSGVINHWQGVSTHYFDNELNATNGRIFGLSSSNAVILGTNQWQGDVAYPMFSLATLANGNNLAVPLTNVFTAVSGPSAAFTINGIYGGRSGRFLLILNRSGQLMTLANESGVDPTPANRLTLSPAADATYPDGSIVLLIYDGTSSRWRTSLATNISVTVSATNALATLKTNGVLVTSAWTNLNLLTGANNHISLRATNTSGTVDLELRDNIPDMTYNAAQFLTNGNALAIANNFSATNGNLYPSNTTSSPLTLKLVGGHNADALTITLGPATIGGFETNGIPYTVVSNASTRYYAVERLFNQTADLNVTNITTAVTSLVGTGVGSMTLPAGFWQVGRAIEFKLTGILWTPASPGNFWMAVKVGSTQLLTNSISTALTASLVGQRMNCDFTLTCRTNSSTGYIQADGGFTFPSSTGETAWGTRHFKVDTAIFDTTASALLDLVCTNGASTTSYNVKTVTVKIIP